MGLDITAYSKLVFQSEDGPEDYYRHGLVRIYTQPHEGYNPRLDGKKPGFYKPGEGSKEHAFLAGSYSGYNDWRERLCRMVHDVSPNMLWNNITAFEGKAFVELINFSDCEGSIGPVTSAKLAKDFAEWEMKLKKADGGRGEAASYWFERYLNWKKAFELAADDGFVKFH